MVITYHGLEFFKVQFGDRVLAFNPPEKSSDHKSARFGADIVMSSIRHEDFMGGELLNAGEKEPFIISSPGEYEVKEVFIKALPSVSHYDGKERINTIYIVTLEDMSLCFLGALDTKDLSQSVNEAIEVVDILFVPIHGEGVLSPIEAHKLAVKLEPAIIIPMYYDEKTLKEFLKEEGETNGKPKERLTVRKSDISGKEGEIVILEANS